MLASAFFPCAAHSAENRSMVESIMVRALLERGAFLVCAQKDNDKEAIDGLTRGWNADLADTAKLLRESGYPEDYVAKLAGRFSLETATPKVSDPAALTKFCAMLGDWKTRYLQLLALFPSIEIKRYQR
jgi:hypothetical protein